MRAATLCLIILYPLTTQFSTAIGDPDPSLFLLLVGVLLVSTGLVLSQRYKAGVYVLGSALGVYIAANYLLNDHLSILYIPPFAVGLFLLGLFGGSLAPGRMPLISQMAKAYHGELPPPLARYTRKLTMIWTAYFTVFGLSVFYLGFIDPNSPWAFSINLGNYMLIALLFVGEYLIRIYRFKDLHHPSFIDFIRLIKNTRLYMPFYHR